MYIVGLASGQCCRMSEMLQKEWIYTFIYSAISGLCFSGTSIIWISWRPESMYIMTRAEVVANDHLWV